jgi:hypothetical protein
LLGLGLLTVFLVKSCTPSVTTTTTTKREDTGRTVSDVATVSKDLTSNIKSLTESLGDVTDVTSAAAAVPKFTALSKKLDDVKELVAKLPESGKTKITELIRPLLGKLGDQFAKLQWIPGVGDKINESMNGIMGKLADLGDVEVPKAPKLSGELAGVFSSLTKTLGSVTDKASAEEAVTKLDEINDKLKGTADAVDKLPADSKSTIHSLVATALTGLKKITDKVLAIADVGDNFKTVVAAIMGKLKDIAG